MSLSSRHSPGPGLAPDESYVELRCSVVVIWRRQVLLLRRDSGDWVLPGGRPRAGEGLASCARREVREETGLAVTPDRCALVGEVIPPDRGRRQVEIVFVAHLTSSEVGRLVGEDGVHPSWVSVEEIRGLHLRPPIGGYLPDIVHGRGTTARYLANLWRPDRAEDPAG